MAKHRFQLETANREVVKRYAAEFEKIELISCVQLDGTFYTYQDIRRDEVGLYSVFVAGEGPMNLRTERGIEELGSGFGGGK